MRHLFRNALLCAAVMAAGTSVQAQTRHTFANPLDVVVGNERAVRGGEPVVIIFEDDYFLFVSHRRGYWYSPDSGTGHMWMLQVIRPVWYRL